MRDTRGGARGLCPLTGRGGSPEAGGKGAAAPLFFSGPLAGLQMHLFGIFDGSFAATMPLFRLASSKELDNRAQLPLDVTVLTDTAERGQSFSNRRFLYASF
nr:MAG: hypothetical protein [Microvirus sp.]